MIEVWLGSANYDVCRAQTLRNTIFGGKMIESVGDTFNKRDCHQLSVSFIWYGVTRAMPTLLDDSN